MHCRGRRKDVAHILTRATEYLDATKKRRETDLTDKFILLAPYKSRGPGYVGGRDRCVCERDR